MTLIFEINMRNAVTSALCYLVRTFMDGRLRKKCALESVDDIPFLDSEENYIGIRPVTPYPIIELFNIP